MPHEPTLKQWAALSTGGISEVFYGGAGGGGKTDWLLMDASVYFDVPGYSAILFRDTFPNLEQEPDGLIPRSREWWDHTPAVYSAQKRVWTFPSGAILRFGHLSAPEAHFNYAGPSYQYIGFDEATAIRSRSYTFMFSRRRRLMRAKAVPLRTRGASNPGGRSHNFFRDRFHLDVPFEQRPIDPRRLYVPAVIHDNPHLDRDSYVESLMELSPVDRARILRGDWTATEAGDVFDEAWFEIVALGEVPREGLRLCRSWDLAATVPTPTNPDPDWTVGMLMGERSGIFYILDIVRVRDTAGQVEQLVERTAHRDRDRWGDVTIWIDQDPGQAGKAQVEHYRREPLKGFRVYSERPSGDKRTRAGPVASAAEAGNVKIVRPRGDDDYIPEFLDEVHVFDNGAHDDQVDTLASGHALLSGATQRRVRGL